MKSVLWIYYSIFFLKKSGHVVENVEADIVSLKIMKTKLLRFVGEVVREFPNLTVPRVTLLREQISDRYFSDGHFPKIHFPNQTISQPATSLTELLRPEIFELRHFTDQTLPLPHIS